MYYQDAAETSDAQFEQIADDLDPIAMRSIAQATAELVVSEDELRSNEVPVLAVYGEHDEFRADIDALVDVLANTKVTGIPGRTHLATIQDPAFVRAIHEFLTQAGR